jgi:N-acetylglutamate synthase
MIILGRVFDELMRAGWPSIEEVQVDGWIARFAHGVTQRANSVLPLTAPTDFDAALTRVEALYAERSLPTIFQLDPDSDLDRTLAHRGYTAGSPTVILAADLDEGRSHTEVEIAETPDQRWLDLWWAVDGRGGPDELAVARKILAGGPAIYATIGEAAVGRLALVGEWGGLYCLAVRPDARRQGLGATLLAGLLAAGRKRGVTRSWLQVRAENSAARRLYQRAGYTEVARYHYRSHTRQEPVQHVHAEP